MRISDWSSDVCSSDLGLENIRLQGLSQSNDARIVAGEGCCEFAQHALRETVQTVPADAAKEGEYNPTGRAPPVAERRTIKHGGREIESAIDIEVLEDVRSRSNKVGHLPDRRALHRSAERRVGKECVRQFRYRRCPVD